MRQIGGGGGSVGQHGMIPNGGGPKPHPQLNLNQNMNNNLHP